MQITPETTNPEIDDYLRKYDHDQAKIIRAQLLHQRRIMRIEAKKEAEKNDPYRQRQRPDYRRKQ